jgi:tripartite-type tricarboxylate transporter receptor subunit TctC
MSALMGGHILVGTGDINYSLLEAGEIRPLLLLADNRSTDFPQTPILKDIGYDIPAPMFINVVGPKAMPEEIVNKLEAAFTKAIREPSFIKGMKDLRLTIVYRNSKEMGDFVAAEYEIFAKVLKEMGRIK